MKTGKPLWAQGLAVLGVLLFSAQPSATQEDLFAEAGVARQLQGDWVMASGGPDAFQLNRDELLTASMALRADGKDLYGVLVKIGGGPGSAKVLAVAMAIDGGAPTIFKDCSFSEIQTIDLEVHLCSLGLSTWERVLAAAESIVVQVETSRARLPPWTLKGDNLAKFQAVKPI